MKLKLHDMEAKNDQVTEKDYLDFLDISIEMGEKKIISCSNGLGLYTWKMKLEILIHELPLMLENLALMKNVCCPKKFTLKILPKILRIHFNQFTCENDFTHYTQDEDHGSRRASPRIEAIGKPYRERKQMMTPYRRTQFSDSSNKVNVYSPYVMSYGQPSSSTDEEYGMPSYSPSTQISYQVPNQME
ncbi:hypothetical protein AAG906_001525 [Vitis piasezkii]